MTKRNLLLVGLLLALGLGVNATSLIASTGSSWTAAPGTEYDIRSEGDAEGVAAVTLTSNSAGTIPAGGVIAIDYNAPIAQSAATGGYAFNVAVSGTGAAAIESSCNTARPAVDTYLNDFVEGGEGSAPLPGTKNNRMTLTCTSAVAVDATTEFIFTARVAIQGYPNSFEVEANVRVTGTASLPMVITPAYAQDFVVADIEGGAGSGFTAATTVTLHHGPEYELTCIGATKVPGTTLDHNFSLNIAENWVDSLTSYSDEIERETDTWAVAPSNGSNILINLTGIPDNVTIEPLGPYVCTTTSYMPCTTAGSLTFGTTVSGSTPTGPTTYTEWFGYPLTATIPGVAAVNATFPFHLWSYGPLAPNQGFMIYAQVYLTDKDWDITTTAPADGDMPWFSLPEDSPMLVVEFLDCRTNLLFPYINTFQGGKAAFSTFGTGVIITNTTADPYALGATGPLGAGGYLYPDMEKGAAVPQSGPCTIYLYPENQGLPSIYTTPSITPGGLASIDVGSGALDVDGTNGLVVGQVGAPNGSGALFSNHQGYAIAICNFQNAHGFAEIYDNYSNLASGAQPTATLGYLADVLPDPAYYRRSPAGDGLGETAIAPINIPHFLLKLLMKGKIGFGCDDGATSSSTSSSVCE